MSARQLANRRNQIKIDAVVADLKAERDRKNAAKNAQISFSSQGLSNAVKRAQQQLSEQFGIPTFDIKGNISTLPQTRSIDRSISVGTGRFTQQEFNASIDNLLGNAQNNLVAIAPMVGFSQTASDALFSTYFTCKAPQNMTQSDLNRKSQMESSLKGMLENQRRLASRPARGSGDRRAKAVLPGMIKDLQQKIAFINCQSSAQVSAKDKLDEDVIALERLIMQDPLTEEIKARITEGMEQVNATLTSIAKFGADLTTQALLEVGEVMNAGRERLRQKIEVEIKESIGIFDSVIDFFKPATDLISSGLEFLFEELIKSTIRTPETILRDYDADMKAVALLRERFKDDPTAIALRVETIQKEIAKQ